jgi:sugar lactone lactonase YvrE
MKLGFFLKSVLGLAFICVAVSLTISGCRRIRPLRPEPHRETAATAAPQRETTLVDIAASQRQWTGVGVSKSGRVFVNYPRWSGDVPFSVGEILESGDIIPYPDDVWNDWSAGKAPAQHLICVQSVVVDSEDFLWILDPASAYLQGVVPGGAKLLKVDLATDEVVARVVFDEDIAPAGSYLNDVRVDTRRKVAYITDSGLGAIIVVDLETAKTRRLLAGHHSTKSEDIVLVIDGRQWLINGQAPRIHADGLALDKDGEYLYYQAMTGRTLYRIATRWLGDADISERDLEARVEYMGQTCAADGIEFGHDGYLYLTDVENGSIGMLVSPGSVKTVVEDPRLLWPDSFARGPDRCLYVTTSQIHISQPSEPYRLLRFGPLR